MDLQGEEWLRKGATLSDKTARSEFGLTQEEIIAAIRAGEGPRTRHPARPGARRWRGATKAAVRWWGERRRRSPGPPRRDTPRPGPGWSRGPRGRGRAGYWSLP